MQISHCRAANSKSACSIFFCDALSFEKSIRFVQVFPWLPDLIYASPIYPPMWRRRRPRPYVYPTAPASHRPSHRHYYNSEMQIVLWDHYRVYLFQQYSKSCRALYCNCTHGPESGKMRYQDFIFRFSYLYNYIYMYMYLYISYITGEKNEG